VTNVVCGDPDERALRVSAHAPGGQDSAFASGSMPQRGGRSHGAETNTDTV
jgi:hypothetical protein